MDHSIEVVISLIDLNSPLPEFKLSEGIKTNVFRFQDIEDAKDPEAITLTLIAELAHVIKEWKLERDILIHCHAGRSRSTAAALLLLVLLNPNSSLKDILEYFRGCIPWAQPNRLMVEFSDIFLNLNNNLIWALWRDDGPLSEAPIPTLSSFKPIFTSSNAKNIEA